MSIVSIACPDALTFTGSLALICASHYLSLWVVFVPLETSRQSTYWIASEGSVLLLYSERSLTCSSSQTPSSAKRKEFVSNRPMKKRWASSLSQSMKLPFLRRNVSVT